MKLEGTGSTQKIVWYRGDIPKFRDDGAVKIGAPDAFESRQASGRELPFEVSEYARLLHVLMDPRMLASLARDCGRKSRDDLDREPEDPWSLSFGPLYNDPSFKPPRTSQLAGGVTLEEIDDIDPSILIRERPVAVLKKKWGEVRSAYTVAYENYQQSGQNDESCFSNFAGGKRYVLYYHCALSQAPSMETLILRTLPDEAQRETGIGEEMGPGSLKRSAPGGRESMKKRKGMDINVTGLDAISKAIGPVSRELAVMAEKADATKKKSDAIISLLKTMKEVREQITEEPEEEHQEFLKGILKSLKSQMKDLQ